MIWMQESKKSSPNTPPSGTTVSLARIMAQLQWGRDLEVAERKVPNWIKNKSLTASMGPRLGSRGKYRIYRRQGHGKSNG